MNEHAMRWLLLLAGLMFLAFVVLKLLPRSRGKTKESSLARARIADAQRRARDRSLDKRERATALREAALVALQELGHPGLATSYARRAERLDPNDTEAVGLLARVLQRGSRTHALERFLWRRLAEGDPTTAGWQRALQELVALYEGPLKRPEVSAALRQLCARIPDLTLQKSEEAGRR